MAKYILLNRLPAPGPFWRSGRHCGADGGDGGGVSGRRDVPPVSLQVLRQVLARLVQLVLVQGDVEHLGRALRQLVGGHHLHVEVPAEKVSVVNLGGIALEGQSV